MRFFFPVLLLAAAMLLPSSQSYAQSGTRTTQQRAPVYTYCHRQPMSGAVNCGFTSFQQCMATASGDGGDCIRNPALPNRRR